jgi:hypothetical protein
MNWRKKRRYEFASGPRSLQGFHGADDQAKVGANLYVAFEREISERYGKRLFEVSFAARDAVLLRTPEEYHEADREARTLKGETFWSGHDHLGAWGRSRGYDAVIVFAAARAASGAEPFGEMIICEPERAEIRLAPEIGQQLESAPEIGKSFGDLRSAAIERPSPSVDDLL